MATKATNTKDTAYLFYINWVICFRIILKNIDATVWHIKESIMKKKTKGFTLIEMCLVIAIIAILILLIVPNITQQKQKAEQKNRRSISDDFTDTIRTTK